MKALYRCLTCTSPVEAEQYQYCYDCWWDRDPRNPNFKSKKNFLPRVEIGTLYNEHQGQYPIIYPQEGEWPETNGNTITFLSLEESQELIASAFEECAKAIKYDTSLIDDTVNVRYGASRYTYQMFMERAKLERSKK